MALSGEQRFRVLVDEHAHTVANYLRRRLYPLGTADLDDLVEETLIVAWRRVGDIPEGAEAPYLIGIARNVLKNAKRGAQRRTHYETSVRPVRDQDSAEDVVVADLAIRDALEGLSDADREVLLLNAWDGLDVEALARVFSITTNAAAVRLSRAQKRFRDALASTENA